MTDFKIPELTIEKAQEHIRRGELFLRDAEQQHGRYAADAAASASLAAAHFQAAMAITSSILLTDER